MKIRADRQAETRRRITEAAIRLHEEVGPLRTSIAAVARRAGVERPTVYRHFPDEVSLLKACQEHWLRANPPPDIGALAGIIDPQERLRAGLFGLYSYYRKTRRMNDNLFRDAPRSAPVREVLASVYAGLNAAADLIAEGFRLSARQRRLVRAAVGHAIAFETWWSLSQSGLGDGEAAELMMGLVNFATELRPRPHD
jgi:AcrR family transcriptional regulator